jgi:hypothetical protein
VANVRGGIEVGAARPEKAEGAALSLLRERVESYLRQGVGACHTDADGDYQVTCDSARVFICPRVWTDERTIVRVFSITNVGLPPSPDLLEWLTTRNFQLTFGHFAYNDAEQSVWMIHNLLGDFLDKDELVTAVQMVATQANDHDDVIKAKFGGRLFTES